MSTYTNSIKTKTHPILVKTDASFLDTMQHNQFDWPNQHNRPIQQNKPNNVIKDKGKHHPSALQFQDQLSQKPYEARIRTRQHC